MLFQLVKCVSIKNEANTSTDLGLGYYVVLGYKPTNRLSLNLKSSNSFKKDFFFKSYQLGFEYIICLKKGGRQFFMLPGIGYSLTTSGTKIGRITLSENMTIDHKKLSKGEHMVYSGNKNQAIAFNLKFKTAIGKRLSLAIGVDYLMPLKVDDHIIFKEDFGLIKRQVSIALNNQLEYYENNTIVKETSYSLHNFSINTGIRFEF